jgi:hypothetical protein
MKSDEFYELVERRLELIKATLIRKGNEYSKDANKLHNFDTAARISGQSRERALDGMLLKHYVSYKDIIDNLDKGILPTREYIDEKFGDIVNYFILSEACLVDRINKQKEE